jgi:hypothetical protein
MTTAIRGIPAISGIAIDTRADRFNQLAIKAVVTPRSPNRRGRQTKGMKVKQIRRPGSSSVLLGMLDLPRVRYSAVLMSYQSGRTPISFAAICAAQF